MAAAEAAEAAREQGKFWEMHDLIFANQEELDWADYPKWAQQLGMNRGRFTALMQQPENKSRIEEDSQLATSVGAEATPTFFINGLFLEGAKPFVKFKEIIDREVVLADALLKNGNALDAGLYKKIVMENQKNPPVFVTPSSNPQNGRGKP